MLPTNVMSFMKKVSTVSGRFRFLFFVSLSHNFLLNVLVKIQRKINFAICLNLGISVYMFSVNRLLLLLLTLLRSCRILRSAVLCTTICSHIHITHWYTFEQFNPAIQFNFHYHSNKLSSGTRYSIMSSTTQLLKWSFFPLRNCKEQRKLNWKDNNIFLCLKAFEIFTEI